jgi:hypothetical protein
MSRLATFAAIAAIAVGSASISLAAPKKTEETKKEPAKTEPASTAVFPKAVDPKYSKESPGKAREHTCLDQYNANKKTNSNGGLTWIQKGGGYYSECNKRLKT